MRIFDALTTDTNCLILFFITKQTKLLSVSTNELLK